MSNRGIFPNPDDAFNTYLQNSVPYLQTNWNRLVPSPAVPGPGPAPTDPRKAQLLSLFNQWNVTFPQSQNPNLRTKTITETKDSLREELEDLLRSIYADIPQSFLTQPDRETLNLPKRDTTPSPKPKITTAPDVALIPLAGAEVRVRCRIDEDASRASMHPDADAIEVKYKIGGDAPTSVNDLPLTSSSKKALFILETGLDNGGKRLYLAARWANISTADKSGPWSTISNTIIIT